MRTNVIFQNNQIYRERSRNLENLLQSLSTRWAFYRPRVGIFSNYFLRSAQPQKNTKQFDNDVKKKTITACFLFSSNLFFHARGCFCVRRNLKVNKSRIRRLSRNFTKTSYLFVYSVKMEKFLWWVICKFILP